MSKVSINESTLTSIGEAIRAKTGKSELIAPLNMPDEINAIEAGVELPEEAFNITGECNNRFANNGWNWFAEEFGHKVNSNKISGAGYMFSDSKELTKIPFALNFNRQASTTYMFKNCQKLKEIGPIVGLQFYSCEHMFDSCYRLKQLPKLENPNWVYLHNNAEYQYAGYMFYNCYSLRSIPEEYSKEFYTPATAYYYHPFYNRFYGCYTLDEVTNIDFHKSNTITVNVCSNMFTNCARLARVVFVTQEDGTPYAVNWKGQTIDLTTVGCLKGTNLSFITGYNSGITVDKEVKDDATYQALKNDPDWFAWGNVNYSRYNHNSAVETINSLPDTSAYLAANGGTNTIKFAIMGSKTDGGGTKSLTEEEIAVAAAKGWTVTFA